MDRKETSGVQKLAEKLSEKRNESYSDIINFSRKISFALLRSAILCPRGCKSLENTSNIDNSTCLRKTCAKYLCCLVNVCAEIHDEVASQMEQETGLRNLKD